MISQKVNTVGRGKKEGKWEAFFTLQTFYFMVEFFDIFHFRDKQKSINERQTLFNWKVSPINEIHIFKVAIK